MEEVFSRVEEEELEAPRTRLSLVRKGIVRVVGVVGRVVLVEEGLWVVLVVWGARM